MSRHGAVWVPVMHGCCERGVLSMLVSPVAEGFTELCSQWRRCPGSAQWEAGDRLARLLERWVGLGRQSQDGRRWLHRPH